MLYYDENVQKKKSYTINLRARNLKNNFYYATNSVRIGNFGLLSSYFYINMDNILKYIIIKLILTVTNYQERLNNTDANIFILIYINNRYVIFLNNCENLNIS